MKTLIFYVILAFVFVSLNACQTDKPRPCPDKSIKHNNACTTDCPGVTACNGQFYCNACEAAREGYWVE